MPRPVSFVRIAGGATLVLALVGACGGRSASDGGNGNPVTGRGGSGNTAGKPSKGGGSAGASAMGGSGSTGMAGSSTGASSSTAGSSQFTACTGPAEGGPEYCDAAIPRWSHDDTTGICRPIIFGGCDATKNNYESLAECQTACPPRKPDYDSCQVPSECVVLPGFCCGPCDNPNLSAHDLITYNSAHLGKVDTCNGDDVLCEAVPRRSQRRPQVLRPRLRAGPMCGARHSNERADRL